MHKPDRDLAPIDRSCSVLMWDMAGTLLPFDPITGRAQALPGGADFLPEIGRDFRQVVTTGDDTASARNTLRDFELLGNFEEIFGDLFHPVGKPYLAILNHLGAVPDHSLVIGDRLRADLPADTDQLVTILVNQDRDIIGAGMVAFIIHILRKQRTATFCEGFDKLLHGAFPHAENEGPQPLGTVTRSGIRNDGFDYRLWTLELSGGGGLRRIILL